MSTTIASPAALMDVYAQIDLEPVGAEGVWITDRRGRRYLDFYGGHAVALLGYRHPRLLEALAAQARALFFQSNLVDLEIRRRAAGALVCFAPAGLDKVFFVNSGAEANENALRIAFLATRRTHVVALRGAFHGRSAAAAAATDGAEPWYAFPCAPFPVRWVPFDDGAALDAALASDTAALILEPVQGLAGARPLAAEFLRTARRLTAERGIVFIADEVQCGMGRSGFPFAVQASGVVPDLLTTAKGLGGGFPVAAVLARADLVAQLRKGDLGTTFGGGPLACALVEAVIETIESEGLLSRVRRLSARIAAECRVGPVAAIRGSGFLLGLETRRPAAAVLPDLRERGILAGGCHDPQVVRLLPPLTLEDEHVDILRAALAEIPA